VTAGTSEGQGSILFPFDLVENVQNGHTFQNLNRVGFIIGLFVFIRIEPEDFKGLDHGFISLDLMISQESHQKVVSIAGASGGCPSSGKRRLPLQCQARKT
jgi:hypothetical protein